MKIFIRNHRNNLIKNREQSFFYRAHSGHSMDISGSFTCQSTCFIIILNLGKLYYDNYARLSIFSFLFLTVIFFKDDFQLLIWKNCRTKNGDLDRFVLHYFFKVGRLKVK